MNTEKNIVEDLRAISNVCERYTKKAPAESEREMFADWSFICKCAANLLENYINSGKTEGEV